MNSTIANAQSTDTKISLRSVTPNDLDLLKREMLIAELAGRPIAFTQFIDPHLEDSHYWGEVAPNIRAIDIWIGEADALGQGYGSQIMQLVIEKCFADAEVTSIIIDPLKTNVAAQRFYQRLGFEFVEERCFTDALCSVYELCRETWKGINNKFEERI